MPIIKKLFAICLVAGLVVALVPAVWAQDGGQGATQVNINTASAEELTELKGIGPEYAERIIEFRESHGAFNVADDITQIPGIGAKTLEANKDRIVIE